MSLRLLGHLQFHYKVYEIITKETKKVLWRNTLVDIMFFVLISAPHRQNSRGGASKNRSRHQFEKLKPKCTFPVLKTPDSKGLLVWPK